MSRISHLLVCLGFCLASTLVTQGQTATHKTPFDFDGDNKTDMAVYRPSNSAWYIFQSQTQTSRSEPFGISTDRIVPGDYDGDGKDDLAVFRPTDMTWYIMQSRDGFRYQQWGLSGDLPFAGDYDGDGKTDLVVIRTGLDNQMTWHILRSTAGYTTLTYGAVGDIPVRGDFDGDNRAEVAVWRPTNGGWYYRRSTNNADIAQIWGMGSFGDMVGAGDYDGDNKTDLAVWRSSTGVWYVLQSSNNVTVSYQFGGGAYGDVPVPGDYDGDGKYDYAVWRAADGIWYIQRSQAGFLAQQWGSTQQGDKLAPFAFVPTGTVVGTVKSDADVPVAGALVEVTEQGKLKAVTTTSSAGYFFLPGVSTGQYEIRVSYKSANASANCSTDTYQDTRLTNIGLVAGGTTNVNVTLARQNICLEDNFNTAALGSLWQKGLIGQNNYNDNNVNVVNQRVEVIVPAAPAGSSQRFSGVRSVNGNYNLRDAYVSARVKTPIEGTSGTYRSESRLEVGTNQANKIQIILNDLIMLRKVVNNVETILLQGLNYSAVTKAYVRLRFKYEPQAGHSNRGRLFLETSPSGTEDSWVTHGDGFEFNDFDLSAVYVSMSGGTWEQSASGTAAFDDFKFAKYRSIVARAGDDQMLMHNNTGATLQGGYECAGCANISNVSYKWTLASKPVGAPDPTINTPAGASTSLGNINFPGSYNYQLRVTATYTINGQSYTSSSTDTVRLNIAEAPFARINAPDSIMEDEPIVFDGSLSSGAYEYEWDFGDGRKAELARATHLYMTPTAPQTRTVTLTVKSEACNGLSTAQCASLGGSHTVSKTVRVDPVNAIGEAVRTFSVPGTHATLQAALDDAADDNLRTDIILSAGVDYGSVTLPIRDAGFSKYIVIKSASQSLPPKGTRISEASIANMPRISTQNSQPAMQTQTTRPAAQTQAAVHHYRFIGILFRRHPGYTNIIYNLVALVAPDGIQQTVSNTPHHFVFDRCIFSNIPFPDSGSTSSFGRRGLQLDSREASVINSHFREFKDGSDSQAIASWSGPGPHAIVNNYLEGAAENILYGGATMGIAYATPSDITIRGNYLFKPTRWESSESGFALKNLLELKHARHVVIDGNVMRNSYPRGQEGDAIVLTVRNQNSNNPWSTIQHVQVTNNRIDNVGRGFNILEVDDVANSPSLPATNFIIRNNLWERVGATAANASDGWWGKLNGLPYKLWLNHNTVFHTGTVIYAAGGPSWTTGSEFHFDNNLVKHNAYGFTGDGIARANGFEFLNTFAPGWRMRHNVMFIPPPPVDLEFLIPYPYPNDPFNENRYLSDTADYQAFTSQFLNLGVGNYRLRTTSFGYQWATDSPADVGCNIDQMEAATAGSVTGNWPLP